LGYAQKFKTTEKSQNIKPMKNKQIEVSVTTGKKYGHIPGFTPSRQPPTASQAASEAEEAAEANQESK
jgi:hypothetical protein